MLMLVMLELAIDTGNLNTELACRERHISGKLLPACWKVIEGYVTKCLVLTTLALDELVFSAKFCFIRCFLIILFNEM